MPSANAGTAAMAGGAKTFLSALKNLEGTLTAHEERLIEQAKRESEANTGAALSKIYAGEKVSPDDLQKLKLYDSLRIAEGQMQMRQYSDKKALDQAKLAEMRRRTNAAGSGRMSLRDKLALYKGKSDIDVASGRYNRKGSSSNKKGGAVDYLALNNKLIDAGLDSGDRKNFFSNMDALAIDGGMNTKDAQNSAFLDIQNTPVQDWVPFVNSVDADQMGQNELADIIERNANRY